MLLGETEVFWNDPKDPGRNLRVMVGIWNDPGGWALASDDFVRAPEAQGGEPLGLGDD